MREVTTPVPVEGGVADGALPMSAGTFIPWAAGSRTDRHGLVMQVRRGAE